MSVALLPDALRLSFGKAQGSIHFGQRVLAGGDSDVFLEIPFEFLMARGFFSMHHAWAMRHTSLTLANAFWLGL